MKQDSAEKIEEKKEEVRRANRAKAREEASRERMRKNELVEKMIVEYHKTGDLALKEKILVANLPLITYICERLAVSFPQSVEFDDLKSLGTLGLIDAIENFKPEKQVRFTSYAALRIKGSVIDGLRSLDWVPRSVRKKARNIEKVIHELQGELGRPATDVEMAERMEIEVSDYHIMLEEVSPISFLSLNDTVYEDGDQSVRLGEIIEDNDNYGPLTDLERKEVKEILIKGINSLPEREKLVLALYYYEELTLKEIGEVMQISESRVCQIHTEAMLKLRSRVRHTI